MEEEILEEPSLTRKKMRFIPKLFLTILFIIIIFLCYIHFLEPKLIVTEEVAIIVKTIPENFNGFKIAQISDIHFGRTTNEKELEKTVRKINEMKPDIVIFTGDLFDDYINLSEDNIKFLKSTLSNINANLNKYSIMGDSDITKEDVFKSIMNEANFTVLDNTNIPIYYNGNTPIYLSGIPSIKKNTPDYSTALKKDKQESYQILMAHEPTIFDNKENTANLSITGHSLGGLIRIPFVGGIFKGENVSNYESGLYENDNKKLYVSGGIGTENISARFLNLPSVTLFRLYNN